MKSLSASEKAILLSAKDDGHIPFPHGRAQAVSMSLDALVHMEAAGYVRREMGEKLFRPYILTEKGEHLREKLHS